MFELHKLVSMNKNKVKCFALKCSQKYAKSMESEISPTGNRDSGISVRLMEEDRMDILRKQERDISSPPFQKFLKGTGCIFGTALYLNPILMLFLRLMFVSLVER